MAGGRRDGHTTGRLLRARVILSSGHSIRSFLPAGFRGISPDQGKSFGAALVETLFVALLVALVVALEEGLPSTSAVLLESVPGHHCNARFVGRLAAHARSMAVGQTVSSRRQTGSLTRRRLIAGIHGCISLFLSLALHNDAVGKHAVIEENSAVEGDGMQSLKKPRRKKNTLDLNQGARIKKERSRGQRAVAGRFGKEDYPTLSFRERDLLGQF